MWRTLNWKEYTMNNEIKQTHMWITSVIDYRSTMFVLSLHLRKVYTLLYVYRAVSAWKSYNKRCCTISEKKTPYCYIIWFLPWLKVYFGQVYNEQLSDVYVRKWFICWTYLITMTFVSKNIPSFLSFLIEVLNILQKQPTVTFSSCIHTPVVVKEGL